MPEPTSPSNPPDSAPYSSTGSTPDSGTGNAPGSGTGGAPDSGTDSAPDSASDRAPDSGTDSASDSGTGSGTGSAPGGPPGSGTGGPPGGGTGSAPEQAAGTFAARYARRLDIAAVFITGLWHLGGAGQILLRHLDDYSSAAVQIAAWAVLAVVIAVAGVLLFTGERDGRPGRRGAVARALAVVTLVVFAVVMAGLPDERVQETDWAWGSVGWTGVVLLLRRPLWEPVVFMVAAAAVNLGGLAAGGGLHRLELSGFVTALYGNASIQLAVVITARTLAGTARQAAEAALAEAEISTARAIADEVHAARQARYRDLRGLVEPLLGGLAAGTLRPADEAVRRRCLGAAARLRRLFAESDDTPDPLVHELRACADAAERRGLAVALETAGAIPSVPPEIRRGLVEPIIDVLVGAHGTARITVLAEDGEVAVCVLANAPAGLAPATCPDAADGPDTGTGRVPGTRDHLPVTIDAQHDDSGLWVEARWKVR